MAFHRLPLPALTTTSLPISGHHSSASSSSSPLTPFSELSTISSGTSICLKTPSFVSDGNGAKPSKNYITYPEHSFPPRQLTPPPKSRFVPLFESYSKSPISPANLSRRGSLGDDEASPTVAPITLPFSAAVTEQMMNPRLSSSHLSVEPALKSAFLAGSNSAFGHWPSRSDESSPDSKDQVVEKLNNSIKTLRHQMNLKNHRIQLAETQITRLSSTCNTLLEEKTKLSDSYSRARMRIEELELLLSNHERPAGPSGRPAFTRHASEIRTRWGGHHFKSASSFDQKVPLWQDEVKKQGHLAPLTDGDVDKSVVGDVSGEIHAPAEPVSDETYQAVLSRIPEMPSEVIIASMDKEFLSPEFDFVQWLNTNGLELPGSAKRLADMSWEDRLRLDGSALEDLGVIDDKDRSYIMRVLKAIAEGEYPHLHESFLLEPFSEEQYVTIMREQRIDKHVPNLSGIPWPLRLFVDEEDLELIQVQKAGARGTIMTVFGGLRKGGVRPDPRPRRGTKKSKRAKMETAQTTINAEESNYPENGAHSRPSADRRGRAVKIMMGHQGPRIGGPRDKGAFAPVRSHPLSSDSPSWYGHRV